MLINKFAKKYPADPLKRRMIEIEVNAFMSNDCVTKENMKALEAKVTRKINPPEGKLNVENRKRMKQLGSPSPDGFNYNEMSIGTIGMNNAGPSGHEGKKQFPEKRDGVNAQIRKLAQAEKTNMMMRHNSAVNVDTTGENMLSRSIDTSSPAPLKPAKANMRASIDELMQRKRRGNQTCGTVPIKISTSAAVVDRSRISTSQAIYEQAKEQVASGRKPTKQMNMKLKQAINATGIGKLGQPQAHGQPIANTVRNPISPIPVDLSEMNSTGKTRTPKRIAVQERDIYGNLTETPFDHYQQSPPMSTAKARNDLQRIYHSIEVKKEAPKMAGAKESAK